MPSAVSSLGHELLLFWISCLSTTLPVPFLSLWIYETDLAEVQLDVTQLKQKATEDGRGWRCSSWSEVSKDAC